MIEFKTEIVKTKEFGKKTLKVFRILFPFAIAYFLYVLFWNKDLHNVYSKISMIVFYLLFSYVLIKKSFIKPRRLGCFEMNKDGLNFNYEQINKEIKYASIEKLSLKYMGYGSLNNHSIYGNKNFLIIEMKDSEKFSFEILIRSKKQKEILKKLIETKLSESQFELSKTRTKCEY